MEDKRPLILISNDDGIGSAGIKALVDYTSPLGDIVVVAPDGPQSGMSSAITVENPLRITCHPDYNEARMVSVNGTPTDCVKIAMHSVLTRKPDLMISGINHGSNASVAVIYSGTMGAAFEACMCGVPAVGFSLLDHSESADFTECRPFVERLVKYALEHGTGEGVCLNVNIPAHCTPLGIKVVRGARGHWSDEYTPYVDPMHRQFFMLGGHFENDEPDCDDTDLYWLTRQYVTVVPVKADPTDLQYVNTLRSSIE